MFGKLKDKLKGALNIFSKKAVEAAEEKEVEQVAEMPIVEEPKVKVKKEPSNKVTSSSAEPTEPKAEEKEESRKEEPKKEAREERKKEVPTEEKEEITIRETPKEVKPKEEHLSENELEREVSEERLERLDEQIKGDKEIEEVPQKFSTSKMQYEPDTEKVKEIKQVKEEVKEKPKTTEDLIKETKEKFADEHLTFKEKKEKKESERKPTAEELLEEIKEEETEEPEVEEPKKGFFGKIKQSFTTKTISADKFEDLFWDLEIALLENNVSVEVIEKIKEDLKEELVGKPLPRDVLKKIEETLARTMKEILTFDQVDIIEKSNHKKPLIIAFFGINGSGKTTSIAKLANYLKENGKSVVLAACDTFRAAAIQQLEEHANKLEVKMIKHDYGSDAAAVAFDAVKYAEKNNIDVVLIDTAGRLHSNVNLMAELEKIIRVTNPDLKIFVGESITGNDCIEQARKFNELVEMDGAILTKADIDEKGGAPLSIAYTIKKPILFLGMGQEYKDFEVFNPKVILDRLGF